MFSEEIPVQSSPPCSGSGLLQSLALVCDPCPHVLLHEDQDDQDPHPPSTGHVPFCLTLGPTHLRPLPHGVGLLQYLLLVVHPSKVIDVHELQPPSRSIY